MQLFQGRKQNLYSFLFTLPKGCTRKLHLCTLVFLYLFFRRKITEMDHAVVIPSEVVRLEPNPPQFQIWARSPAPLQTMIEKNKIMILWSICTLIFRGGRGDAGPVTCTCASSGVQEVVVWTAFTSACHSEGSIISPQNQDRLRLIQHWWWKFQMLN